MTITYDTIVHEMRNTPLGQIGDLTSISVVIASLAGWLPSVASLLTVIWLALRIWESDTVREWTGRTKNKEKSDDENK